MTVEEDMIQFMSEAGQLPDADTVESGPSGSVVDLRLRLLDEEHDELVEAVRWGDRRIIAKEIADLVYVAVGTAVAYGLPFDEVWDIVHEANMSKLADKASVREDGKVLKSDTYRDPHDQISELVAE